MHTRIAIVPLLAALVTVSTARAEGRLPGSLLLFPQFDNRSCFQTLVTVANTSSDVDNGTVRVEFVYIGRPSTGGGYSQCLRDTPAVQLDCQKFDRSHLLTPGDTLTVVTSAHNPQLEQGFLYVVARDHITNQPISFNHLIGNLVALDGMRSVEESMNAVAFSSPVADLGPTDVDGDGFRDLDGSEYDKAPAELLVPRFSAVSPDRNSELILIGLTGGTQFTTLTEFLIYNDNEEAFSVTHAFRCWERVRLASISGAFSQAFLETTNHVPGESLPLTNEEYGWFRVKGLFAFSVAAQVSDPAIYTVLLESFGPGTMTDLPFESGARSTGALWPQGIYGAGPFPGGGGGSGTGPVGGGPVGGGGGL